MYAKEILQCFESIQRNENQRGKMYFQGSTVIFECCWKLEMWLTRC